MFQVEKPIKSELDQASLSANRALDRLVLKAREYRESSSLNKMREVLAAAQAVVAPLEELETLRAIKMLEFLVTPKDKLQAFAKWHLENGGLFAESGYFMRNDASTSSDSEHENRLWETRLNLETVGLIAIEDVFEAPRRSTIVYITIGYRLKGLPLLKRAFEKIRGDTTIKSSGQ